MHVYYKVCGVGSPTSLFVCEYAVIPAPFFFLKDQINFWGKQDDWYHLNFMTEETNPRKKNYWLDQVLPDKNS